MCALITEPSPYRGPDTRAVQSSAIAWLGAILSPAASPGARQASFLHRDLLWPSSSVSHKASAPRAAVPHVTGMKAGVQASACKTQGRL